MMMETVGYAHIATHKFLAPGRKVGKLKIFQRKSNKESSTKLYYLSIVVQLTLFLELIVHTLVPTVSKLHFRVSLNRTPCTHLYKIS